MNNRTETSILASAMYALARDIDSEDKIVNAAIFEAAERLELQQAEIERLREAIVAEREACAMACEKRADSAHYDDRPAMARQCARDIRARSG